MRRAHHLAVLTALTLAGPGSSDSTASQPGAEKIVAARQVIAGVGLDDPASVAAAETIRFSVGPRRRRRGRRGSPNTARP
jgi:hypothetical protein